MFVTEVYHLGRFFFSLYQFSKGRPNRLVKYTKRCGPLAIKLIQFLLMRDVVHDKELEFAFENCDIHDFKETQRIYLSQFGKQIEEDYLIDRVIASGSIGQVYLAYSKKEEKLIALKVKHPYIDNKIFAFSNIIKILLHFFKTKYNTLVKEYLENISTQLDYKQEAKNTIKLKETWKYEKSIIVPHIYNYTNDIICMSYHEGTNYQDLSESDKTKASMYMNFIVLESLLVHDYLHADLHIGNWKVINENGIMKILLYDCGIICSTGNVKYNQQIISHILGGTFTELVKVINDPNDPKVKKCSDYLKENLPEKSIERVRFFIDTILDWNLCRDKQAICILSAFALIGEISGSSSKYYTKYIGIDHCLYECVIYIYIHLLGKIGLFLKLKDYLEDWMDSDPCHKERYESWLYERFRHTKGYILNDIIYSKLNFL